MNERQAKNRWQELTGAVRDRWSALSEDDVLSVRGNTERLITLLQTRYGFARDEAIRELAAWSRSLSTSVTSAP